MSIMDELRKLTRYDDDDDALIDDDMDMDLDEGLGEPAYTRPQPQTQSQSASQAQAAPEPINMGGAPVNGANASMGMNLGGMAGMNVMGSSITKYRVVLVQPEKFDCATPIADHLLNGDAVILNCESTDKDVARRVVDFLSGCAYALKGDIRKAANNVYILVPRDVGVDSAEEDEKESGNE